MKGFHEMGCIGSRKVVLDLLKRSENPLTVQDIANLLKISPQSAAGYVGNLNGEGKIKRNENGEWSVA